MLSPSDKSYRRAGRKAILILSPYINVSDLVSVKIRANAGDPAYEEYVSSDYMRIYSPFNRSDDDDENADLRKESRKRKWVFHIAHFLFCFLFLLRSHAIHGAERLSYIERNVS